MKLQLLIN